MLIERSYYMPQKLSNLAIGSKVRFGSLHGSAIAWVIADKNHTGYPSNSVTVVSEKIIKLLCYDAREPTNGNSNRQDCGNNRYIYANIRQWLNSESSANNWYEVQHSADAPPSTGNVYGKINAYDTIPGFLNGFTENERNTMLTTNLTASKSATDGGGVESFYDKVFLLSCTEVGLSGDHICGVKLPLFSDNVSRRSAVTAECVANSNWPDNPASSTNWDWLLRDANASSAYYVRIVDRNGGLLNCHAYYGYYGLRPAVNLSSDLYVSDFTDFEGCYIIVYNQPPSAPDMITVPSEIFGGGNITIQWTQSSDPDGNLSGYIVERKVDTGKWTQIYKGAVRYLSTEISYGWKTVQYRVKAYDSVGAESAYITSAVRTVTNNKPPAISGGDGHLGSFTDLPPSYEYTVTDTEGHQVTVVETLDSVTLRIYTATLGSTETMTVGADTWRQILNGTHTLQIKATDSMGDSATRTLTITKSVTSIEFVQAFAMAAQDMPTKAIVNIQGHFPIGSTLTIEICNNGYDTVPSWEDITNKALTSQKHFFSNTTKTAENWGVRVRVKLLRGSASEACFIQSIGGNYE